MQYPYNETVQYIVMAFFTFLPIFYLFIAAYVAQKIPNSSTKTLLLVGAGMVLLGSICNFFLPKFFMHLFSSRLLPFFFTVTGTISSIGKMCFMFGILFLFQEFHRKRIQLKKE